MFDLLHIVHIRYFEQAKRMGDVLWVLIIKVFIPETGDYCPL